MRNRILNLLLIAIVTSAGLFLSQEKAEAQLILVESKYRVVSVDRPEQRIGVALPDANPNKRQNWVYVKPTTKSSIRRNVGGLNRDDQLGFNEIFDQAQRRKGGLIKVHGGRDFDGSIDAKTIWF